MSWLQHSSPRSSVQRTERELEQHLNWPPCVPLFTGQAPQPLKYHYQPTDARSDHKQSCPNTATTKQQDYKFRYDDGLSARLGVKRIPLLMGQHGRDGQFVFQPSPYGVDKPLRTQPKQLQPYWTPVKSPETPKPKIHTRRHIGVFCDPNLLPPNETILKNF